MPMTPPQADLATALRAVGEDPNSHLMTGIRGLAKLAELPLHEDERTKKGLATALWKDLAEATGGDLNPPPAAPPPDVPGASTPSAPPADTPAPPPAPVAPALAPVPVPAGEVVPFPPTFAPPPPPPAASSHGIPVLTPGVAPPSTIESRQMNAPVLTPSHQHAAARPAPTSHIEVPVLTPDGPRYQPGASGVRRPAPPGRAVSVPHLTPGGPSYAPGAREQHGRRPTANNIHHNSGGVPVLTPVVPGPAGGRAPTPSLVPTGTGSVPVLVAGPKGAVGSAQPAATDEPAPTLAGGILAAVAEAAAQIGRAREAAANGGASPKVVSKLTDLAGGFAEFTEGLKAELAKPS